MDLLDRIQRVAPPGQRTLSGRTVAHIAALTAVLLHRRPAAIY